MSMLDNLRAQLAVQEDLARQLDEAGRDLRKARDPLGDRLVARARDLQRSIEKTRARFALPAERSATSARPS